MQAPEDGKRAQSVAKTRSGHACCRIIQEATHLDRFCLRWGAVTDDAARSFPLPAVDCDRRHKLVVYASSGAISFLIALRK